MRWLVTTSRAVNPEQLEARLGAEGGVCDVDAPPVPLDDDEQVISVTGPADLDRRFADDDLIIGVYPDSEYDFYAPPESPPGPAHGTARRHEPL